MAQEKKNDIFISYSRKDSAIADEICKAFDQAGITYFIDRKGIRATANYINKIAEEIDNSKAMLLLASANSYESKFVSIELLYAFNHDVVVLPYALDNTPTPKNFEILLIYANWHYLDEEPISPNLLELVSEFVNKNILDTDSTNPSPSQPLLVLDPAELAKAKREALPEDRFQVGDLVYKVSENCGGVTVCGWMKPSATEIRIPSQIKYGDYTYDVDCIGDRAFFGCSGLTSVTIPNSVTRIGDRAFEECSSLTSITIPNSVTNIGKVAFSKCKALTSITIPHSVTSIGEYAFFYCSGLTSMVVEKGNKTYDSRENCNAIIQTASNILVAGCSKTIIPNSVTSIGDSAFWSCSGLTSITIPNSVTSIGDGAFCGCSGLTTIIIPNNLTSIRDWMFSGCSSLTTVTIPNSVTSIGDYVFSGCKSLTSISIPNSVTSIGEFVFSGCSSLTSITIPNSVTSIEKSAFSACQGLTFISIPNSVTKIGDMAFGRCSSLTSITIPNSVTSIGNWAFKRCSNLISVTIPNSVTSIGKYAFIGCDALQTIKIPKSLTDIGEDAFPVHTRVIRRWFG